MLEGLFSTLNPAVPPVPSPKNQREPLEAANYAAVPPVPPVPSEKTETKTESDGRHYCQECQNFRNGYCTRQRFRPVDDIPRRCEDFTGYPVRQQQPIKESYHDED